jgi:glucose-6-phosphate dehydrogenase assembly protein OpcA
MSLESATVSTSVEAIQAELSRTKVATSTLNFIVWIDDAARRDWVLERAAMLAEKHPSLMLVFDHTGVREGDATVTTAAHGAHGAHAAYTVQGERVDIDVSGTDAATVVGYVTALCRPSVPTVLWWTGIREGSREIFYGLLPHVQTLVFDSSGGARDDSALRALVAFHREHPETALRDLAWMRLLPWQVAVADFFEGADMTEELYTIRALHVASGSDSEAFYLGGWLASRLGWKATARDAFTDARGKPVKFQHRRAGDIRRVMSICLDSETSWYHGEVTEEDAASIRLWVEGEHAREPRVVALQAIDNASLLERAVLEPGTDELFETALRSAGTLLGDS